MRASALSSALPEVKSLNISLLLLPISISRMSDKSPAHAHTQRTGGDTHTHTRHTGSDTHRYHNDTYTHSTHKGSDIHTHRHTDNKLKGVR